MNQDNPPLIFTVAAATKVWQLIAEDDNPNLKLRVYISGGGCSGFQYGFMFDETIKANDTQVTQQIMTDDKEETVVLLVDALSLQYLEDAEIDYREDISGAQFVIKNPNATTTCGCGSSFSMD